MIPQNLEKEDLKLIKTMATDKQKLARARNWSKFCILGTTAFVIRNNQEFAYSDKEKEIMNQIEYLRKQLILGFDETSKHMGLTVLPKCWCGKVGKYPATDSVWKLRGITHLCGEHKDDN